MTKKTTKALFTPIFPGTAPGSFLPSPELARANEFARMLFDLEQSIEDRNATPAALREAVSTYQPEFAGHARDLLESIAFVEAGHRKPRLNSCAPQCLRCCLSRPDILTKQ